jgi:hypothetical protein
MALTKEIIIDKIEFIGEHRHMQLREATVIKEDGVELSRSVHRRVLAPDESTGKENAEIKRIAAAVWTKVIKDAHAAAKEAREEP